MAVDRTQFINKVDTGIKANKDYTKFYLNFKVDGKNKQKVLDFTGKDWTKSTRISNAKRELISCKEDLNAGYKSTEKIKLDKLFSLYSETLDDNKQWSKVKTGIYNRYIKQTLGNKAIANIREMDVDKIITSMTKQGLSPRTRKGVLEVLKPLFRFAVKNKYIKESPVTDITVKIPSQKKVVTNATALFQQIHSGITSYYNDNPFYQALFLFGFTGRRKSEVLNLKWENIDFTNDYYWIEDTKNDDKQKYPLPDFIKKPLLEIKDEHIGLVFKSPVTGGAIANIDRQVRQLKQYIGIENLSMHYMRNILVSMLAEQQTEAIVLSGILGHKDVNTINKYLSINHYKSGQIGLDKVNDVIDVSIIDADKDK